MNRAKYAAIKQDDKLVPIVFSADISHSVFKRLKPKSAGEVAITLEGHVDDGFEVTAWTSSEPNSLGLPALYEDAKLIVHELTE